MRRFATVILAAVFIVTLARGQTPVTGGLIAFIRFPEGRFPGMGFGELYIGHEGEAKPKRFAENAAYPAWSPDGNSIAIAVASLDQPSKICIVDVAGGEPKCIFKDGKISGNSPTWSPDGKRIAFICDRDLCVMNADGTSMTRITHNEGQHGAQRPAWSPDGSAIAFMSYDGTKSRIATMAPDGSQVQVLTPESSSGGHDDCHPAWWPDGKFLLFSSDRADKFEIYMMRRDGTGLRRVYSHNIYGLQSPVATPDGRLAFDALSPEKIGAVANNDQFWPPYMRHPAFPKSLFGWQRECFVLSADGKEVHHLFPDQCGFVAFQPSQRH